MPVIRLLALAAALALAGCTAWPIGDAYVATVQGSRSQPVQMPQYPASPATCEATLAYWNGLKIASLRGADEPDEIRRRLRKSAEILRKLPVVGVDPELVEKVLVLAREMENTARLSQYMHDECWPPLIPVPEPVTKELLNTGSLLTQASDAVAAMRPVLSQQYGVEFPAE